MVTEPRYRCPEPGCGLDVTEAVEKALTDKRSGVRGVRLAVPDRHGGSVEPVAVECPRGHTHWYPERSGSRMPPAPVTPSELERLNALRATLAPEDGLKTVETFAKYLVTSAATVGTLGAAINVTGIAELAGTGETLFVLAVGLTGLSLALAVWALTPAPVAYNPNQISSMDAALRTLLRRRQRILVGAAILFAAALVLAGVAPIVSSTHEQEGATGLTYSATDSGKITATAQVFDGDPLSPVTLAISRVPGAAKSPRASARSLLDSEGVGSVTADLAVPRAMRKARLVARFRDSDENPEVRKITIAVRRKPGSRK